MSFWGKCGSAGLTQRWAAPTTVMAVHESLSGCSLHPRLSPAREHFLDPNLGNLACPDSCPSTSRDLYQAEINIRDHFRCWFSNRRRTAASTPDFPRKAFLISSLFLGEFHQCRDMGYSNRLLGQIWGESHPESLTTQLWINFAGTGCRSKLPVMKISPGRSWKLVRRAVIRDQI